MKEWQQTIQFGVAVLAALVAIALKSSDLATIFAAGALGMLVPSPLGRRGRKTDDLA